MRIIALLALILIAPYSPARTIIRMGTLAPNGSSWHKTLEEFAFKVKQETGGDVIVKIYAGGVVGDEAEMIRKLRIGQLQAAAISSAGLAEIEDAVFALSIPMMFESYEEWDHVRNQINPQLEAKLIEKGFRVLTWSDVGWVYFFSKQPFSTADELSKMKLAASTSEPEVVEIMKWAGLNPVPISTVDLMTGLQTGLIDATYMPLILAEGSQVYRQANHLLMMRWLPLQGAIVISEKGWDAVADGDRAKVKSIADAFGARLRSQTRQQEEESLAAMKSRGLEIREVLPEEREGWRKRAQQAYPQISTRIIQQSLFDEVVRLRDAYRSSNP